MIPSGRESLFNKAVVAVAVAVAVAMMVMMVVMKLVHARERAKNGRRPFDSRSVVSVVSADSDVTDSPAYRMATIS